MMIDYVVITVENISKQMIYIIKVVLEIVLIVWNVFLINFLYIEIILENHLKNPSQTSSRKGNTRLRYVAYRSPSTKLSPPSYSPGKEVSPRLRQHNFRLGISRELLEGRLVSTPQRNLSSEHILTGSPYLGCRTIPKCHVHTRLQSVFCQVIRRTDQRDTCHSPWESILGSGPSFFTNRSNHCNVSASASSLFLLRRWSLPSNITKR